MPKFLKFLTKIIVNQKVKGFLEKINLYYYLKSGYRSFIILLGKRGLKLKVQDARARMIVSNPNELSIYQSLDGEKTLLQKFLNRINNKTVFYDIGANIGMYSLCAAKYKVCPKFIYCWEPEPFNFKRLKENIDLNDIKNITAFPVALGSENVVLELWTDAKEPGSLTPSFTRKSSKSISVQVVRGDDWVLEKRLYLPSIIKIDVEGYELNVLKSFKKTISKSKPIIFLEIHPFFLKNLGIKKEQVLNFLYGLNYTTTFSSLRENQEHYILESLDKES
ncbi:MAG: FkbM family methyltransferase [Candidatus Nealsonbacteria bacterium]